MFGSMKILSIDFTLKENYEGSFLGMFVLGIYYLQCHLEF